MRARSTRTGGRGPLPLLVPIAGLALVLLVLVRVGGRTGGTPPLDDPRAAAEWLAGLDPALLGSSLVRVAALVATAYLLAVIGLGAAARASHQARLVRAADRVTLPVVRRLLGRSFGLGLAASVVVGAGPGVPGASAQDHAPTSTPSAVPADTPVMVLLDDDAPSTTVEPDEAAPTTSEPPPRRPTTVPPDPTTTDHPAPSPPTTSDAGRATQRRLPDPPPDTPSEAWPEAPPATPVPLPPPPAAPSEPAEPEPAEPAVPVTPVEPSATWTIAPGEHLWAVAEATLAERSPSPPSDVEVARYLRVLIEANRDRLVDPANPDLVHPGLVVVLPPP